MYLSPQISFLWKCGKIFWKIVIGINTHMKTYTVDPNATREERDAAIRKISKALLRTLKTLERAEPQESAKTLGS